MRPKHWIYTIPLRLRSLFRRGEVDLELAEELRDQSQSAGDGEGFPRRQI